MTTRAMEDVSRTLAQRDGTWPVVSLYLDVDGKRYPRFEDASAAAAGLLHRARLLGAVAPADLLEARLAEPLDRHRVRGIALFADSNSVLGVVHDARPFENVVTVARVPDLLEIEDRRHRPARLLVVLADRSNARLLHVDGAGVATEVDLLDPRPRNIDDDTGFWWTGGFDDHLDEVARRHLRRVVRSTTEALRKTDVDGLVVGGPDETVAALTAALPAEAATRLLGRIGLSVAGPAAAAVDLASNLVDAAEEDRRHRLVEEVHERLAQGSATLGLGDTLRVLGERRVGVLLVERGYEAAASWCERCDLISPADPGPCPVCPGRLMAEGNVVPGSVVEAIRQDAEVVALDRGALGDERRIAALCRY